MTLHAEVLPPEQQEVLRQLARPVTECGFYLGGGTAIARIWGTGNRATGIGSPASASKTPWPSLKNFRAAARNCASVVLAERHCMEPSRACERVSWSTGIRCLRLPSSGWISGAKIASLDDLAAMKLLAVDQRVRKGTLLTSTPSPLMRGRSR